MYGLGADASQHLEGLDQEAPFQEPDSRMGVKKPDFRIGERIYEGLKPGQPQPMLNALVAMVTLTLYGQHSLELSLMRRRNVLCMIMRSPRL